MPCTDGGYTVEQERAIAREEKVVRAALCALLSAFEKRGSNPFAFIDYKEAGFKVEELESWWSQHKKIDAARRAREEREQQERQVRNKALAKLTAEEKRLLNLR